MEENDVFTLTDKPIRPTIESMKVNEVVYFPLTRKITSVRSIVSDVGFIMRRKYATKTFPDGKPEGFVRVTRKA